MTKRKSKTDVIKSTEYIKYVFLSKKFTNKNDTYESWKAGTLWRTLCLSIVSGYILKSYFFQCTFIFDL